MECRGVSTYGGDNRTFPLLHTIPNPEVEDPILTHAVLGLNTLYGAPSTSRAGKKEVRGLQEEQPFGLMCVSMN